MKQLSIRVLYDQILKYEGDQLYEKILKSWATENDYRTYTSNLFRGFPPKKTPDIQQEDLWELYALLRVLDLLTLYLQPNHPANDTWQGVIITKSEFIEFVELLGLETSTPQTFHTFDCEILEAHRGETDFLINECYFPTIKLKNVLIKRAGVKIELIPENHPLELINNSCIYWTHRRKNRKCHDESQGWGSNSQWTTDLRIDLETETHFIYNLYGKFDLNKLTPDLLVELKEQDLTMTEAIELVKFRHFIHSTKDDSDLYPYQFRYDEGKNKQIR